MSAHHRTLQKFPAAPKPGNDDPSTQFLRERGTLDMGGMTALLYAARDNQMDAAKALLEGGADVKRRDPKERGVIGAFDPGHLAFR